MYDLLYTLQVGDVVNTATGLATVVKPVSTSIEGLEIKLFHLTGSHRNEINTWYADTVKSGSLGRLTPLEKILYNVK